MPRKIYIIRTPNNQVNWATTEEIVRTNPNFADGNRDFGAGSEPYVKCPGCKRELPLVVFDLDHIKAQSRYALGNLATLGNDRFVVLDENCRKLNDEKGGVLAEAQGGVVKIQSGSKYYPKLGYVQSVHVWKNDLRNLQFLCTSCNRSKGNLDWESWGKSEVETRPLSKIWKGAPSEMEVE